MSVLVSISHGSMVETARKRSSVGRDATLHHGATFVASGATGRVLHRSAHLPANLRESGLTS